MLGLQVFLFTFIFVFRTLVIKKWESAFADALSFVKLRELECNYHPKLRLD